MGTKTLTDEQIMETYNLCVQEGGVSAAAAASGESRDKLEKHIRRGVERGLFTRDDLRFRPTRIQREAERRQIDPKRVGGGWDIEEWYEDDPKRGRVKKRQGFQLRYKDELAEQEAEDALATRLEAFKAELPRYTPVASPPPYPSTQLAAYFNWSDVHIGQRSWWREGGADWDLKIAEDTILAAARVAISHCPLVDVAILHFAGDWRHFERYDPVTNRSGHVLDADGRTQKVGEVAVRLKRTLIDEAAARFQRVVVLDEEGNHDETSQHNDRAWLKVTYEWDKRVTVVDEDALPFSKYQHGETLLLFHHGHVIPFTGDKELARYMLVASRIYRDEWAACDKVYMHFAHRHHRDVKTFQPRSSSTTPVELEQHPTLAGASSDSARRLLLSPRAMNTIIYHEGYGEVMRFTLKPEMLRHQAHAWLRNSMQRNA